MLNAVELDGLALEFAPKYQGNEEIVETAVEQNAYAAKFSEQSQFEELGELLSNCRIEPHDGGVQPQPGQGPIVDSAMLEE